MPTLYLATQGGTLGRSRGLLTLRAPGETARSLGPLPWIERVVVLGKVTLNADALDLLLGRRVPVVLCSVRGRYKGSIRPPGWGDTLLRLAQASAVQDPAFTLRMCRHVVHAKITAMRAWLGERSRRKAHPALTVAKQSLLLRDADLMLADHPDAVRGYEGAATAAYYKALKALSTGPVAFPGTRSKRPPRDPFNALLSFLYTLLTAEAADALAATGLDPALGFLHAYRAGRASLACDLIEPYRSLAVDRLVVKLFNNSELAAEDFEDDPAHGTRMREETLRRVIAAWEAHLTADAPAYVVEGLGGMAVDAVGDVQPSSLRALLHRDARSWAHLMRNASTLEHLPMEP